MTLDVKGGLKNTAISSNKYVVLEECLSNAIDSYLIRKDADQEAPQFSASIVLDFFKASLIEDDGYDLNVSCTDNGAGFGDAQVKAFVTKDTSYKDYLKINGIGKCKGAGRIQFFHYFKKLKIDSVYTDKEVCQRRSLNVGADTREISETHFKTENFPNGKIETKVTLQNINSIPSIDGFNYQNIRDQFSAQAVYGHLYTTFLQRLIVLKNIIGGFSISIDELLDGEEETHLVINSDDLPKPVDVKELPLVCSHGNQDDRISHVLNITRYSLPCGDYAVSQHEVALCANSALAQSLTKNFFKNPQDKIVAKEGNFELILIESEFLESSLNVQRDGFNIPKECGQNGELDGGFSLQDIVDSLEDYVYGILTPKDFDKNALIASTQERFGITQSMLETANIKVHHGDTEANIAKRVLKKFQEDIVNETSDIFNIKQELLKLDPRSKDFRDKIADLSWKYTSNIKKMDMANLSQLIVRRSAMIEVLRRAVNLMLECQSGDQVRRDDEKIIHNIFFPTGKNSNESVDHDIWLLNEEYHYFQHIASDKSLASIPWNDTGKLFDSDVDSSLEALFTKNNQEHSKKRPDIAIFNQEGSAIIIEFKAPGVELQDHINDLYQYARLLAAKSNGKIKKFYGYLIGDTLDESRMPPTFKRFPSGLGYFDTGGISDHATGKQYGELYSEVLFYSQFVDRAENRLKVYKNKLNIDI